MNKNNLCPLRIISFLAVAFLFLPLCAQTSLERFVPGATVEGVSYFLPRTALRMVVKAEKRTVTPGDFHMYSFKYMRIQDVPVRPSVTWTVSDIAIHPYGIPDSTKAYSLKLKSRTVAPLLDLSTDGLLLGINTDEASEESLPPVPESRIVCQAVSPTKARSYMNRETLQATSTAKMAELVASEIYSIRESRDALIRGEADNTPKDGAQLKLMLDNLQAQHDALLSMFIGTTEVSEEYYVLDVVPEEQGQKQLLFRFSRWNGLVGADDMSGAPFYMSVQCVGSLPQPVTLPEVKVKKGKMQRAVYYNIPARTEIKVLDSHRDYISMELPMAQFGCEEILSGVLFDKGASTKVTFHQSTGGIKRISE